MSNGGAMYLGAEVPKDNGDERPGGAPKKKN